MLRIISRTRKGALGIVAAVACSLAASSAGAQSVQSVDPSAVIDEDLSSPSNSAPAGTDYTSGAASDRYDQAGPTLDLPPETYPAPADATVSGEAATTTTTGGGAIPVTTVDPATTYGEDDLIGAAEGLFGRGAEGLARVIENILDEQGEPNGYIVGREGGGAFIFGVRYGSGTLFHKVEGNMPVYWTGPSVGLDAGANAGNTFVLVYNLDDTEQLYHRFPAGEGQAYFVGGFTASYLRKGNIVLIPIRVGAGLRLGINAGYMRFSREQRWLPF
jgi:hypothetical protein